MRAVFTAFFVAVSVTFVIATPLTRQKRFAVGGFAGAGFPFSGAGFPFTGAYAGSGVNPFFPFAFPYNFNPMPVQFPVIPFSQIPVFKNWYEGENVCKEEKKINAQMMSDDVIPPDWKDDMPNVSTDYSHEQETCKGKDGKIICVKKIIGNNGEVQIIATKYECCHGFVRDPTGQPGCVESSGASSGKLTANDPSYYLYAGNRGSSSSSISSSSSSSSMPRSPSGSLDKVPIQ